ncbi:MAG: hypothetical protein SYR96_29325 [Actinomycetota bacterium]|nr:hypothetical protein [Actinomycetota bacterium]
MIEELKLSFYLPDSKSCRIMDCSRVDYRDGDSQCGDLVPFDAQTRTDFDKVTNAVESSGLAVERIFRDGAGIHVQLTDPPGST